MQFLFIVTYGRSGSTLLQGVVNSINGYCIRGENEGFLLALVQSYADVKRARKRFGKVPRPSTHPWYGVETIKLAAYRRQVRMLVESCVLNPPPGTRVAGFKEIRYMRVVAQLPDYVELIGECFPGAKFLFNTREVESVITSGSWRSRNPVSARAMVSEFNERAKSLCAERADSFHFHYDDRENPGLLKALFDFLGEEYDETALANVMSRLHSTKTERDVSPTGQGGSSAPSTSQ